MNRKVSNRPITSYLLLTCSLSWLVWSYQMMDIGSASMLMWINYIVVIALGALLSASLVLLVALFSFYVCENAER